MQNLHNEVMFEAAESRINTECSLTVCEGVSHDEDEETDGVWFPHCM